MISMSTMNMPAVGTYAANAVARCVGLDVAALVVLGVPAAGDLTRDDLTNLGAELKRRGYPARAYSLEVFMRQQRETPSRSLLAPWPKARPPERPPAWMSRADLA
jgi:hypothetical protein